MFMWLQSKAMCSSWFVLRSWELDQPQNWPASLWHRKIPCDAPRYEYRQGRGVEEELGE